MAEDGRQVGGSVGVLEATVFLVELLMLGALVYVGVVLPGSVVWRVVAAIGLPVVVATSWGRWLAPRAPRRLPFLPGLALKIVLFGVTALLLGWRARSCRRSCSSW